MEVNKEQYTHVEMDMREAQVAHSFKSRGTSDVEDREPPRHVRKNFEKFAKGIFIKWDFTSTGSRKIIVVYQILGD